MTSRAYARLDNEIAEFRSRRSDIYPQISKALNDSLQIASESTPMKAGSIRRSPLLANLGQMFGWKWLEFEKDQYMLALPSDKIPVSLSNTQNFLPEQDRLEIDDLGHLVFPQAPDNSEEAIKMLEEWHSETINRLGSVQVLPLGLADRGYEKDPYLELSKEFLAVSDNGYLMKAQIENDGRGALRSQFSSNAGQDPILVYGRALAAQALATLGIGYKFFGVVKVSEGIWAMLFEVPARAVAPGALKNLANRDMFEKIVRDIELMETVGLNPDQIQARYEFNVDGNPHRTGRHLELSNVTDGSIYSSWSEAQYRSSIFYPIWQKMNFTWVDRVEMNRTDAGGRYIEWLLASLNSTFGDKACLDFMIFLRGRNLSLYREAIHELASKNEIESVQPTSYEMKILREFDQKVGESRFLGHRVPIVNKAGQYLRTPTVASPRVKVGDQVALIPVEGNWERQDLQSLFQEYKFEADKSYAGYVRHISESSLSIEIVTKENRWLIEYKYPLAYLMLRVERGAEDSLPLLDAKLRREDDL